MEIQKHRYDLFNSLMKNDYSQLEKFKSQLPPKEVCSFTDFISKKMKSLDITRKMIAEYIWPNSQDLDSKTETIKKIINKPGYTTQRDRIIIICFSLKMNSSETDYALQLYGMNKLDPLKWRDLILKCCLDNYADLTQTNKWLLGLKLTELNFNAKKKKNLLTVEVTNTSTVNALSSSALNQATVGDIELSVYSNCDGIVNKYNPANFEIAVKQAVALSDGTKYQIEYCGQSTSLTDIDIDNSVIVTCFEVDSWGPHLYGKLDPKAKQVITPLIFNLLNTYKQKSFVFYKVLDDTKNFKTRVYADKKEDGIYYFAETFNTEQPWNSEYFQLEISSGKATFTKTSGSIFLKKCFEYYNDYYEGHRDKSSFITFNSASSSSLTALEDVPLIKSFYSNFEELKKSINTLKVRLQQGTETLYDFSGELSPIELISFFKVEKYIKRDEVQQSSQNPKFYYNEENLDSIEVSLDMLKRAYRLGYNNIHEIYSMILKKGSLEAILF